MALLAPVTMSASKSYTESDRLIAQAVSGGMTEYSTTVPSPVRAMQRVASIEEAIEVQPPSDASVVGFSRSSA